MRLWLICLLWFPGSTLFAIEVKDSADQWVRLDTPAQRVVTLSPHATELVFAAGGGTRLVGAVEWSDYPPEAKHIPRVGDAARLDRERLLGLRPDLVIAWSGGNRPRDLEWLARHGIPIYHSAPRHLAQIADDIAAIGRLLGTTKTGRTAASTFRQRLNALRRRYQDALPFRYFYQLWPQPLMTVGGASLIGQALMLCKGSNIFAGLTTPSATVSREAVIAADPEVIIAPVEHGQTGDPFRAWRHWKKMKAITAQRLYTVPADLIHRPTPRLLDGIERLCGEIHDRAPADALHY